MVQFGKLITFTGFFIKKFRIRGVYNQDSLDFVLGWFCISVVIKEW